MKIAFHWLISAAAIGIAAYLVPGVSVTVVGALVAAVVLGALNILVRPILFLLTLPVTILTLGLFSLIINGVIVLLAAFVVPGFSIASFGAALLFAIVLAVVNWVFHLWQRA